MPSEKAQLFDLSLSTIPRDPFRFFSAAFFALIIRASAPGASAFSTSIVTQIPDPVQLLARDRLSCVHYHPTLVLSLLASRKINFISRFIRLLCFKHTRDCLLCADTVYAQLGVASSETPNGAELTASDTKRCTLLTHCVRKQTNARSSLADG